MTPHPRRARRGVLRVGAGLALGAVAALLGATAASAHVHVDGEDATRGGYGVLTFRVPTESDTASTTEVTVTMPSTTPIASASVEPVAGWTATVTTARLAKPVRTDDGELRTFVSRLRWTADDAGAAIGPGEFRRFSVSVGPLPDVAEVAFPTTQTYDDGTVVSWNEASDGTAQPEHPAPVLELAAAEDDHDATTPSTAAAASATSGTADAGLAVAIGAAALAVVALVVAVIGLLRASRRGASGA
jgi:uncharacterized protein YcnI